MPLGFFHLTWVVLASDNKTLNDSALEIGRETFYRMLLEKKFGNALASPSGEDQIVK